MQSDICCHCRGTQYVFVYWFEKMLAQQGVHMTDIPPDAFKMIPLEFILYCHCNHLLILLGKRQSANHCEECEGISWRFTEKAEQTGYRWKKVSNLTSDEIKICRVNILNDVLAVTKIRVPKTRTERNL